MTSIKPSAQQVKELRDSTGLSMQECSLHLEREALDEEIKQLDCSEHLRSVLETIIDRTHPKSSRIDMLNR